jgi:hypothetical protein
LGEDVDNVIDLDAIRSRRQSSTETPNPILEALDVLALALADHGHVWTDRERTLYETAVTYLNGGCTGFD